MSNVTDLWQSIVPEQDRRFAEAIRANSRVTNPADASVALLVIDVVHAFTGSRPLPMGRAIEEFPTSCGERAWAAIPAIAALVQVFRRAGRLVIFTRPDAQLARMTGRATTLDGTTRQEDQLRAGEQFPAEVRPRSDELVLPKARASAFFGTPLSLLIGEQGIQSVVLVGGTTSGCVRATAVDATSHGLNVFVVGDACFDRFDGSHAVSLFDVHAKYGTVVKSEDVVL